VLRISTVSSAPKERVEFTIELAPVSSLILINPSSTASPQCDEELPTVLLVRAKLLTPMPLMPSSAIVPVIAILASATVATLFR